MRARTGMGASGEEGTGHPRGRLRASIAAATLTLAAFAALPGAASAAPIELNKGTQPALDGDRRPFDQASILPGEFDGDGKLDVLRGLSFDQGVYNSVAPGDGAGSFEPPERRDYPLFFPDIADDVNADGLDDLIGFRGDDIWVSLSTGDGFTDGDDFYNPGAGGLEDLDSDGDPDAVSVYTRDTEPNGATILVNDGGAFESGDSIEAPAERLSAPAFGDVNGDSFADVAFCGLSPDGSPGGDGGVFVFLGDGAGGLDPAPTSQDQLNARCKSLTSGDMDQDGHDDLLTDGFGVFHGTDSGELEEEDSIPSGLASGGTVALADIDRDGVLDAALGSNRLEIWRGGSTGFGASPAVTTGRDIYDLEVVSLDGVGPADDLIAETGSDRTPTIWGNYTGDASPPPDTNITGKPRRFIDHAVPDLEVGVEGQTTGAECSIDYGSYRDCGEALSEALPDGRHVVTARAIETGNAVDPTPSQVVLYVDTLDPEVGFERTVDRDPDYPSFNVVCHSLDSDLRAGGKVWVRGRKGLAERVGFYAQDLTFDDRFPFDTRELMKGGLRANRGPQVLVARVSDRAGNTTRVERSFRVG